MDADLGFCFLIVEMSSFEFRRYDSLPSAHLGLHSTALTVVAWISAMPSALWSGFPRYGGREQMGTAPIESWEPLSGSVANSSLTGDR